VRVLLIDDDPQVLEDLDLFLRPEIELTWASGSDEALEMLRSGGSSPDAIILDLCLPPFLSDLEEEEGFELLSVLRRELAAGVPVLVLSSLPREKAEHDCLSRGAQAYLEKPCSVKELARLLAGLGSGPTAP